MHMRYFGAYRSALEMLANLLIGVDEQNDVFRRERRRQPGYMPPLPTIVAYGDGRLRPSMRGYEPTPVETFRAVLACRTLVILTNEPYTSIMCFICHSRTVSLVHQSRGDPDRDMWICTNHRKQKVRRTTGNNRKGRKILWCCDEENNPLTRTSQCPDRVCAAGYRRNVYPYRCENVLGRVIDRDLNAANNIGRVFTAYINSNGDPNLRPLYL
ncbi:hypothetical protein BDC45DRAFT_527284 [Circinella umbellata]|nr:hypothetical protein BDC45DRAFT_527284 [Circinella umbellata]